MIKNNVIIGIETTCDDTGIGIIKNNEILANVIISSVPLHQKYGGIIPEIAARSHETNLLKAYEKALKISNVLQEEITHIAFAETPGLPGCLHTGKIFAKLLALNLKIPLIPLNHLYSHIYSAAINKKDKIKYPCLGLVVSGGHTAIYLVKSPNDIVLLDETQDDAIGEVYDKVGRALNLDYPAGSKIDSLYDETKSKSINFLNPTTNHIAFSYSGIKTATINYINKLKQNNSSIDVVDIVSSFQYLIINDFVKRVKFYLEKYNVEMILLGGGVSANSLLRKELKNINKEIWLPDMEFTNDNGAMHCFYANILINENSKKYKCIFN
ncbi:tRNA (adenosine(37)-N6)-threonylcarbamoyltransferase complex transferase subunit TsaD [Mycoplasmoides pirum]|uniref:tRNA (adenosine(37)-N6)-threonylcarbamoyltransferase complex transferase subunit TsaD n=1 Tax=Mycoplasmoides pirum TaxID=2122 RepID=UPI0004814963|nr:tRNA (adenosine(37)-N6)-threonylcarbamoyltransferase complex transferase subunit TsaD [Mycoplasmoides pirum]